MDQTAGYMETEPQQPQHHEYYQDRPKHSHLRFSPAVIEGAAIELGGMPSGVAGMSEVDAKWGSNQPDQPGTSRWHLPISSHELSREI